MHINLENNPFFIKSKAPHNAFNFIDLKDDHFLPALKKGISDHNLEIEKIINNPEKPNFQNTIVALEHSGELYTKVLTIFFALEAAETNDNLQNIAQEISPIITEHSNSIFLNDKLFNRIKDVYEIRYDLNLSAEDLMLLNKTYEDFERNGANLNKEEKEIFNKLSSKLALLNLKFEQNSLNATNAYYKLIENSDDLSGMPEYFMEMASQKAKEKGKQGWLLDLRSTCFVPLMKYCNNRSLREEIWRSFMSLCLNGEFNNKQNIVDIINIRLEIARLFGFDCYADYELKIRMAETVDNVNNLFEQLLKHYIPKAKEELNNIQLFASHHGLNSQIMPWDYSYYNEKLKTDKFHLNEEMIKPYFELEKVKKGIFGLAYKLYGLKFTRNTQIPVYHSEVEAYEVFDEKNKYIAILYIDLHPREGKSAGAWMTEFKGQWHNTDGSDSRPHITIVTNFTRKTETLPSLLTFSEVTTFLHEFGHALHGILSECKYLSLSGTNVLRDFVELPSQIMENWAIEKDFLDEWAVNYKTGEKIPEELVQKIIVSSNFDCGYSCIRQVAFGLQDMAFHTIKNHFDDDPIKLEIQSTQNANILPKIDGIGRCVTFNHIFSGGYAAGYYSYKWAELLDADAFELFKENGIFNKGIASSFRNNILKRGGTEHPMILYKRFRGQEPTITAMLKRNGIQ